MHPTPEVAQPPRVLAVHISVHFQTFPHFLESIDFHTLSVYAACYMMANWSHIPGGCWTSNRNVGGELLANNSIAKPVEATFYPCKHYGVPQLPRGSSGGTAASAVPGSRLHPQADSSSKRKRKEKEKNVQRVCLPIFHLYILL